jgi:predicted Zn-dependent protease
VNVLSLGFLVACFGSAEILAQSGRDAPTASVAAQEGAAPTTRAEPKPAVPAKESDAEIVARWRESLEIDCAREIVDEARALFMFGVAPGAAPEANRATLVTDGAAIALVARARFETGDEAGALSLLRDARPTEATRVRVELARARLAIERDELALALSIVRADGAKDGARFPNDPECWLLLGRARVRSGDARGATEPLLRFVKDAPLDVEAPAAWHMLAQAARERGDTSAAERFQNSAEKSGAWQSFYRTRRQQIRATPDEPLPRLGLAELWIAVDALEKARGVLDDLVRRAPQFARGHARLGDVCVRAGDTRTARAEFDRAIELDPTLAEARLSRAEFALGEKRDEAARADLEWIVASPSGSDPRFARAHLRLARLLQSSGDSAGATQRYARYRELGGTEAL